VSTSTAPAKIQISGFGVEAPISVARIKKVSQHATKHVRVRGAIEQWPKLADKK